MAGKPVPSLGELNIDRTSRLLGRQVAGVSGLGQSPMVSRLGVVTAVTVVGSCDVQLSGDGVTRTIPSVSPVVPVVNDIVRVAQIDQSFLITSVVGGKTLQSGRLSVTITAANTGAATLTFPTPFNAAPDISLTVQTAANIAARISSTPTGTSCTVTAYVTAGGTTTATVAVHWIALGV